MKKIFARRDFTVNAIALDENGKFIDPFGGIGDLKKRVLRHVTDAFAEDPLRVLRAARFAAKLEFKIATDTMKLLSKIVDSGELCTLSEERIQRELILSLQTKAPNNFLKPYMIVMPYQYYYQSATCHSLQIRNVKSISISKN